ncbi:tRNA (guanosine(46)-N7)-methyltransferase TrmB [Buchnera aphidicola]|uniref:tRNA (guanine-N(7)-)-methyltransferase n=1 Tax=Buchnera aphidicola (Anoecia oenotherae) TaxID=1241833 RepID=A0A4D6XVJ6_9GAMM|nr:tRNA (guanosine(46)-N7)-methyltransferase TrmB [Buchnera aphidicola]QCI19547.1 tRNA (guanosine(46)-N7)-methyltransferase TrmB [Buchnera aphidicola (Anoecia oenotherae)]
MENSFLFTHEVKNHKFLKKINSFVCRRRKIKERHELEIKKYWSLIGMMYTKNFVNLNKFFINEYPLVLEIGFGTGISLVETARRKKNNNYLGIEVYFPGILQCARIIYSLGLKNLRIIYYDATEVFENMIEDFSIERIQIFFPDPWPKNKHKKRRLLNRQFIILLLQKLKRGGDLCISTDCKDYSDDIVKTLSSIKNYLNITILYDSSNKLFFCPTTVFEKKSKLLGKINFYILCKKL